MNCCFFFAVRSTSFLQVCLFNAADANAATVAAVKCEWRLFVEHAPDSKRLLPLRLRIVFNTMVYARERITSFLKQLEMVIDQLCAKPDMEIGKVCLVFLGVFFCLSAR